MNDPSSSSSPSSPWPPSIEAKQSITEVLQNPRGELRDSLDFRGAPPPPPPPRAPPDASVTINHFERYLRELAPLYDEAPLSPQATISHNQTHKSLVVDDIPSAYFSDSFSVALSEDLAGLLASDNNNSSAGLDAKNVRKLRSILLLREDILKLLLQEKLTARADKIKDALAEIRILRTKVLDTAAKIRDKQHHAKKTVETISHPILKIDKIVKGKDNALTILKTLRLIKQIKAASDDVPVLLDTNQYANAIDIVHNARSALMSAQLKHIQALTPSRTRLAKAIESIDSRLRSDFKIMTNNNIEKFDFAQLLVVANLCARIGRMEVLRNTYLEDVKKSLSSDLAKVEDISSACNLVRSTVTKAAKVLRALHQTDGENSDDIEVDADVEKQASPAEKLALQKLYDGAQEALCTVLDRLLSSFPISSDASNPGAYVVLLKEDAITEVSCFDEAKAAIRFTELMRTLTTLADDLAKELDIPIASETGGPLRAKCRERVLAFIDAFHKAHVDAVTTTIRSDEWKEVAVPEGTARLVSSVCILDTQKNGMDPVADLKSKENNPSDGTSGTNSAPSQTETRRVAGPMATPRVGRNNKPKKLRIPLMVGGTNYYCVRSGLRFARSICAYALVVDKIPLVSAAAARRGVELSILFNSLVCQAILGAAALEWAGIKTITARHLALASRTVAMAQILSGAVHDSLKEALPQKQLGVVVPLMEKACAELGDSQRQLLAKILTIMMQRLSAHEGTCRNLPWFKKGEMTRLPTPSPYMDRLCLESDLLHRILWSILPAREVGEIFRRVCTAFATQLTENYENIIKQTDIDTKPWIRKRITADTSHLFSQLVKLDVIHSIPDAIRPVEIMSKKFSPDQNAEPGAGAGGIKSTTDTNVSNISNIPSPGPVPIVPMSPLIAESKDTNETKDTKKSKENNTNTQTKSPIKSTSSPRKVDVEIQTLEAEKHKTQNIDKMKEEATEEDE